MDFSSIPILASALSLIISWALFAILCSLVNEAMVQLLSERGRFMRHYIFRQLYDHPNGINWGNLLYMNGAIDLLSVSPRKPTSNISPKLFAETLIQVVGKSHIAQMNKQEVAGSVPYKNSLLSDFKTATIVLQPSDVVNMLQQTLSSSELYVTPGGEPDEERIYNQLVGQIENWYGALIGRLSDWYRTKTRIRLFILGSLLALIFNIDSFQLFSHFNNDATSRGIMLDYYEENHARLEEYAKSIGTQNQTDELLKEVRVYKNEMKELAASAKLPVGWDYSMLNCCSEEGGNFMMRLLGYLVTGFAACFGAPFWFEFMKKIYRRTPENK